MWYTLVVGTYISKQYVYEERGGITLGRPRKNVPGNAELARTGEEIVRSEAQKPKKPRGNGTPPGSRAGLITTDEDRQFVAGLLTETLHAYKQPRVKSDEELQERLDQYFQHCADTGQIPTVEEMALATGYGSSYLWDLEVGRRKGFSDSTAEIVKKAKEFLKTFDAKLVVTGKMNFLAYCFRAKNYYGMVDKAEYVISPSTQNESDFDEDDLRKRYMVDGAPIEAELTDPD